MGLKSPLLEVPGIGANMAAHLNAVGVFTMEQLAGADPEALYEACCAAAGRPVDRCVLYVFRCGVYYAKGGRDREKLRWWNWKDED